MISIRCVIFRIFLGFLVTAGIILRPALVQTADFVTGVNVVNPIRASVADQNAIVGQLKAKTR